jgi:hypothetical protein
MAGKVILQAEMVPFLVQTDTVDGEADAGKTFPDDDLESAGRLVVYQVDILAVVADYAEHIAKIDLAGRDETDIEFQPEVGFKTEGVIRGKVQTGPFFLDDLVAVERQSIRLGVAANRY